MLRFDKWKQGWGMVGDFLRLGWHTRSKRFRETKKWLSSDGRSYSYGEERSTMLVCSDGSRGQKYQVKSGRYLWQEQVVPPLFYLILPSQKRFVSNLGTIFAIPLPFSVIRIRTEILPHEKSCSPMGLEKPPR